MKILAIGDVTSRGGVLHLERNLWKYRERERIDFVVVNGENASFITGISPELADKLLLSGADCITGGNHTMQNKLTYQMLDDNSAMLRPVNFGSTAPGRGYTILDANGKRVLVISAMGNVHIEPNLDSPFPYIERVLSETVGKYDFSILDIHAEATGEKYAIAHAFDGRISAVFGTHTHVQTADEQILPRGTGYITDVGMCGETGGILGLDAESVVERMKYHLPNKFKAAEGAVVAWGVIFELDDKTGRTLSVRRIKF